MDRLELYYEVATIIYDICTTLFGAYCFVFWVKPFMADGKKAGYVGIVYAVGMLTGSLVPFYVNVMLVYGLVVFVAFLVMGRIDRGYAAQKLFLAITFFCVRWQSWRVVACISNETYLLTRYLISSADGMVWFRVYVVRLAVDGILGCILMYGAVRCLLWSYGSRREHMNTKEFLLLVMPSVSGVFAYGIFRYYNYVYERDSGKSPFDLYGSYDLIILVYSVVCFVTIFVMTYVFRQWKNDQEEDKRREVFSSQMYDLERHIGEVERLYRDMRMLRHDMGNHLMTLEELYGQGEYEEAEKYAGELKRKIQETSPDLKSGNPVTDVILSGRKKEMEEKGISFDCEFHYPPSETVNAFDISIILNNALTNAIEATERERESDVACEAKDEQAAERTDVNIEYDMNVTNIPCIKLSSYCMKNMYIIEVSNRYDKELMLDSPSGLPKTTKSGEGHGFGLVNIRHVARKYYGDIEIGKEMMEGEQWCVLRVMMQIATAHNG